MSIVNGRMSRSLDVTYQLTGDKPGSYEIPALDFVISGQKYRSEPRKLEIKPRSQLEAQFDPILKLQIGKTEFYEGEVIPIKVSLYVLERQVGLNNLSALNVSKDGFVLKNFGDPTKGREIINGAAYTSFDFESTISALRAGELILGPAEATCTISLPMRSRRQAPFSLFPQRQRRELTLTSNAVNVSVKAMPTDEKPADFQRSDRQFQNGHDRRAHDCKGGRPHRGRYQDFRDWQF